MTLPIPQYFKNTYEHAKEVTLSLKKGKVEYGTKSAGGRDIYVVSYGEENKYERKANYSSALGAHDYSCYSKKDRPCVFIIGGVHGGEFEGIASVLNLFSLLETGKDLQGKEHKELLAMMNKCHLVFIPCANPDGRSRMPFEGVGGMKFSEFRYYNQGSWEDGSLCGWPECKMVHPMRGYGHLGAYFNDDGINLMHDTFFDPMAKETKLLLDTAARYAPDVIVNLHGAANAGYGIYAPGYAAKVDRDKVREFEQQLKARFIKGKVKFEETLCFTDDHEFNLTTALYLACGGLSFTWESYQGVIKDDEENTLTEKVYDEILNAHYMFYEEFFKLALEKYIG